MPDPSTVEYRKTSNYNLYIRVSNKKVPIYKHFYGCKKCTSLNSFLGVTISENNKRSKRGLKVATMDVKQFLVSKVFITELILYTWYCFMILIMIIYKINSVYVYSKLLLNFSKTLGKFKFTRHSPTTSMWWYI